MALLILAAAPAAVVGAGAEINTIRVEERFRELGVCARALHLGLALGSLALGAVITRRG